MSGRAVYRVPLAALVQAGSCEEAYAVVFAAVGERSARGGPRRFELQVGPRDAVEEWADVKAGSDAR